MPMGGDGRGDGPASPRSRRSPDQSIPLEDLSRPPDAVDVTSRSGSGDGASRFTTADGASFSSRNRNAGSGRYQGIVTEEAERASSRSHLGVPASLRLNTSTAASGHGRSLSAEEADLSPIDIGGFHAAMGGMGPLGPFDDEEDDAAMGHSAVPRGPWNRSRSDETIHSEASSSTANHKDHSPERGGGGGVGGGSYDNGGEDDMAPLTHPGFQSPIDGSLYPPAGQRHDRLPSHSQSRSVGMLGDNLAISAGSRSHRHSPSSLSIPRSISSSGSRLSGGMEMLRKMSMRVVNLSNEPEVVDAPRKSEDIHDPDRLRPMPDFDGRTSYERIRTPDSPGFEKTPKVTSRAERWHHQSNPLKGYSLGIFGPDNPLRLRLCNILIHPWMEPTIFFLILLQTILLAVQAAKTVEYGERKTAIFATPEDFALLVLFVIYSLEIVARVIVSGFIKNADEYSSIPIGTAWYTAAVKMSKDLLAPERNHSVNRRPAVLAAHASAPQVSIVRSFTMIQDQSPDESGSGPYAQKLRLARRAYLRHSFNRLDFVAVVSFWIAFVLRAIPVPDGEGNSTSFEALNHVYVFQMMSCLRITRLLGLTNGTSIILRSLKRAAPSLFNVAFLIGFFWLLFGIIGAQSFKSSLRRTCVWFGDNTADVLAGNYDPSFWANDSAYSDYWYAQNLAPENLQFCGGFLHPDTGNVMPYVFNLTADGPQPHPPQAGSKVWKGYICPPRSICVEGYNPYNNTVSFDNIGNSLEQVFVMMSSNTYSDIMYYLTDSDYLTSAIFYAAGIVILAFWMTNLLIAVITSSFQIIREESRQSAFTTDDRPLEDDEITVKKPSLLKRLYDKTFWLWIAIILFDIVVMAFRTAKLTPAHADFIDSVEVIVTLLLLIEILWRFSADWRNFFRARANWIDLGIAVITAIILLPPIRNSGAPYNWLTFFQIIRIYRIILAVPITRSLIVQVLGNVSGILNLFVFVFLVTFIGAIFGFQILAGEIYQTDWNGTNNRFTFSNIWTSFLGMYQILSSENWTFIVYNATQYETQWNTAWISALFFILWFTFANFIILNMFIAVIQENFDVDEDTKRLEQVKAFLQQKELTGATHANLSLSTMLGFGRESNRRDPIDYGPATIEMFKDTVVRDFLEEQYEQMEEEMEEEADGTINPVTSPPRRNIFRRMWDKTLSVFRWGENPFYSSLIFSRPYEELDPRTLAKEIQLATDQRKAAQRQYLAEHPRYDVSLFVFKPENPIRKFCQKLVGPGRGSRRVSGVAADKSYQYPFSFFIYANIIGMVLLACYITPLYQRDYFIKNGYVTDGHDWFTWTDIYFATVFTLEAVIKVIADGFFFTPNAYFRGTWGIIDFVVLFTLWLSIITQLFSLQSIARGAGAFKSLRALRLLNVSNSARETFHSVIIVGGWKVLSAAFVSLSLLIPFAIYGVNLFAGRFEICNDPGLTFSDGSNPALDLNLNCIGEYQSTPYVWEVLAPRQYQNPYFNFDDFREGLFILFQIVSQEGWIDVTWAAMSATLKGQNPQPFAAQGNAVFFIIFNLLSTVFVATLFISVFMRNYTEQTGVAFLTADQRSWLELRKLLRRISPSKRPENRAHEKWKDWCYKIAVKKHGPWHRTITAVLTIHLILLICEFYPPNQVWEDVRDAAFVIIILICAANVIIRLNGLTWPRFRRSSWDLYSIFAVSGALVTTVVAIYFQQQDQDQSDPIIWVHKLFLDSLVLLLIPRNNALDQLFKTAAASLTAIVNLLATWFVLFLVFAIAMNQTLGLTRFGTQEKANLNLRTVPKALILLFRMSTGEGWNQIMEDFSRARYPTCVKNQNFYLSDCGSQGWSRFLFVAWNLVSMYIFVSLFVSLIFESFSYVYQRSSGHSLVSREETRRFKQAWATFDPKGTGYISKEAFPRLLGELSGVFEMRIYDGEHTVGAILEDCRVENWRPGDTRKGIVGGVDIAKLNERLRTIDVDEIRRRRQRLNVFSQEVLVSAHPDKGIAFTSCLMILAHYNVISDSRSLRLEEFLRRRYRLQRVEEEVNRRIVIGFFDTLYWSRLFRRRRDSSHDARMVQVPTFTVPEIFIEDDSMTPRTPIFPDDVKDGRETPARSPASASGSRAPWNEEGAWGSDRPRVGFGLPLPEHPPDIDLGDLSIDTSLIDTSSSQPPQRSRSNTARSGAGAEATSPRSPIGGSRFAWSPTAPTSPRPSGSNDGPSDPFSLYDASGGPFGGGMRGSERDEPQQPPASASSTAGGAQQLSPHKHRRQKSSVGTMNQMDVFDNSAWGESIKRSFTTRKQTTKKSGGRNKGDGNNQGFSGGGGGGEGGGPGMGSEEV